MLSPSVADAYLETRVATATPQRLRLMLIDEALRQARLCLEQWGSGPQGGYEPLVRCREIVAELMAGIRPDATPEASRTLDLYVFLFSMLTEAQLTRDPQRVADVVRVLVEEQETWQQVCLQLPERPVAAEQPAAHEELAPQRVAGEFAPLYGAGPAAASLHSALSLDA